MKTLIRTITICIAVNLMIAGIVRAQDATNEPSSQAEDIAAAELAIKEKQKQADKEQETVEALKLQLQELTKLQDPDFPFPVPTPVVPEISISTSGHIRHKQLGSSAHIIPSTQMNVEEIIGINEDMNVMSRIFDQSLNQKNLTRSWTYAGAYGSYSNFSGFFGGGSSTQSMYIQGYGALFMMNVDFPLSPLSNVQEEQEQQTEEDVDPVWEDTRRQIYEPQDIRRKSKQKRPEIEYDAEKVENLKTTLIKSLKHAVNIRALKSDESVILTITGNSEFFDSLATVVMVKDNKTKTITTPSSADAEQSATAKLVIRAKRSDIDAFANADINLEQFREKVQILSCPYVGDYTDSSPMPTTRRTSRISERGGRSSGMK